MNRAKRSMAVVVVLAASSLLAITAAALAKGGGKKKTKTPTELHLLKQPAWTSVEAGADHACAVGIDGSVWCWGDNYYGQLGNMLVPQTYSFPTQVIGASKVESVSPSRYLTCAARKKDGVVSCWGSCSMGACGIDPKSKSGAVFFKLIASWNKKPGPGTDHLLKYMIALMPVQTANTGGTRSLATGGEHGCVLKKDGSVWCWGEASNGQLGGGIFSKKNDDGYTFQIFFPTGKVPDLGTVTDLSARGDNTCVVKDDGTVWCWGRNDFGQLGNGSTTKSCNPVQVSGITDAASVAAGERHTCAVKNDGTAWCWGSNSHGQLGDGTRKDSTVPVQVTDLADVAEIAPSWEEIGQSLADMGAHTCALKKEGTVWCWGLNKYGQLGDKTTESREKPVQVVGLEGVSSLAVGSGFNCAFKTDSTIACWGGNHAGQIGVGAITGIYTPTPLYRPPE